MKSETKKGKSVFICVYLWLKIVFLVYGFSFLVLGASPCAPTKIRVIRGEMIDSWFLVPFVDEKLVL